MGHSRPLLSFANVLLDTLDEKVRQAGRILDCPVLTTLSGGPGGKRHLYSSDQAKRRRWGWPRKADSEAQREEAKRDRSEWRWSEKLE